MSVSINQGKPTVSTLTVTTNEPFILTGGENGLWGGTAVLNSNNNHSVKLAMTLEHAAHVVGHPAIITGNGQTAKIETNDGDSTFTLEFQAKPSQL
jgi:hypothetical protein